MNYRLDARAAALGYKPNPLGAANPPADPEPSPRQVLEEMIAAHRELAGDPEACMVIGGDSNFPDAAQAILDELDSLRAQFN